jgi:hypothetical protein
MDNQAPKKKHLMKSGIPRPLLAGQGLSAQLQFQQGKEAGAP